MLPPRNESNEISGKDGLTGPDAYLAEQVQDIQRLLIAKAIGEGLVSFFAWIRQGGFPGSRMLTVNVGLNRAERRKRVHATRKRKY